LAASNRLPIVVNASVSDEAANTVTVPVTAVAALVPAPAGVLLRSAVLIEEQPATIVTAAAARAVTVRVGLCTRSPW